MKRPENPTVERLDRIRGIMEESRFNALLVTVIENVRYLTGFTGSSAVAVITPDDSWLVTDGRYREQAAGETVCNVVIFDDAMTTSIARLLEGVAIVGFEEDLPFGLYRKLGEALGDSHELKPTVGMVEGLRSPKDPREVHLIRDALHCAGVAFSEVLPLVKPGVTERELAAQLDYRMMLAGADGPAFDTVVASGPNSSLPHAGITDRVLAPGDLVVIDFGARKNGYCSDTTRTMVLGEPNDLERRVLDAVSVALEAALSDLRPGIRARDLDSAAREHIEGCGFGDCFVHGLGHGVGLEVHEKPSLSRKSPDTLDPGMVFTVEPGVYVEGECGARLEEMVLMTETGFEVISNSIPVGSAPLSGGL